MPALAEREPAERLEGGVWEIVLDDSIRTHTQSSGTRSSDEDAHGDCGMEPVVSNPLGIAVALAADVALLCVTLGETPLASASGLSSWSAGNASSVALFGTRSCRDPRPSAQRPLRSVDADRGRRLGRGLGQRGPAGLPLHGERRDPDDDARDPRLQRIVDEPRSWWPTVAQSCGPRASELIDSLSASPASTSSGRWPGERRANGFRSTSSAPAGRSSRRQPDACSPNSRVFRSRRR